MAMARSALQSSLRRLGHQLNPSKRNLSSSAHHDDACVLLRILEALVSEGGSWFYGCTRSSKLDVTELPQSIFPHLIVYDETAKWEKITYLGIVSCTALAIYNLSKGHPHHEDPPAYPYLHIRNKEFPWGPDGLFEAKHKDH